MTFTLAATLASAALNTRTALHESASAPLWVTYVTLAIAVIGAVRPDLRAAYNRIFRPRKIDIYEKWTPEFGFTFAGPVIAVSGSFYNQNSVSFVTDIRARLQQHGTPPDASMVFSATLSRRRWIAANTSPTEAMQWLPFRMEADQAYPYDVLLSNNEARERMMSIRNGLNVHFETFMKTHLPPDVKFWKEEDQAKVRQVALSEFASFQETGEYKAAVAALESEFIWKPGKYRLTLEVDVAKAQPFRKEWPIVVSVAEQQAIRSNIARVLAEVCYQPPVIVGTYFFANPPYGTPS